MSGKAPHGVVLALTATLLVTVLGLAGCASSGAAPDAAAPAAAPALPVSTPDGYQDMLNQTDAELSGALTAVGQAP
ncbi:MAG: hypothetical protein QOC74_4011, partial [Pseudonocardiales bacterium]|nr:hypothetical protein [Pseudonocardiales bacterium]